MLCTALFESVSGLYISVCWACAACLDFFFDLIHICGRRAVCTGCTSLMTAKPVAHDYKEVKRPELHQTFCKASNQYIDIWLVRLNLNLHPSLQAIVTMLADIVATCKQEGSWCCPSKCHSYYSHVATSSLNCQ